MLARENKPHLDVSAANIGDIVDEVIDTIGEAGKSLGKILEKFGLKSPALKPVPVPKDNGDRRAQREEADPYQGIRFPRNRKRDW